MTNVDLGQVIRAADEDAFWALRAKAIQSYANLEQSLFRLFTTLTEMDEELSSIVFVRLTSAHARNSVIEKLFQKKHGTDFNLFRNSLIDQLQPINVERNEIVHWNTVTRASGRGFEALVLMPPGKWATDSVMRDSDALAAFLLKCKFYGRLINMFTMVVMHPEFSIPDADRMTWLSIFSQPIRYPPPMDHPLFPKPEEQQMSSQAIVLEEAKLPRL